MSTDAAIIADEMAKKLKAGLDEAERRTAGSERRSIAMWNNDEKAAA